MRTPLTEQQKDWFWIKTILIPAMILLTMLFVWVDNYEQTHFILDENYEYIEKVAKVIPYNGGVNKVLIYLWTDGIMMPLILVLGLLSLIGYLFDKGRK